MRTTFSRWPGPFAGAPASRDVDVGGEGPAKAHGRGMVMLLAVFSLVAGWLLASVGATLWAGVALLLCLVCMLAVLRRLQAQSRDLAAKTTLCELAFCHAGIAMWREDWSAAARAVDVLRAQGVVDIEGHFARHPEQLRALRAQVFIKDVNRFAVEEMGGRSKADLIGSLDTLLPDTDQTFVQWLVAFARKDRLFRSEAHVTNPDGSIRHTLFAASLPQDIARFDDLLVISIDITDFRQSQEHLLEAEARMARATRMATAGALTASIAHEVNGPLAAIMANAEAALRFMDVPGGRPDDVREALAALVEDAGRAARIVQRTRAFINRTGAEREAVDVVECLRQTAVLLGRELRDLGATVHVNAVEERPMAHAEIIPLQQIFVNLLLNAAQAMEGRAGPRDVRVDVRQRGETIEVDVVDSGPGIAADDMRRVFDSFYSTRSGGMGMGLAIALASAEGLGGALTVSNVPESGAAFHLQLPVFAP